MAKRSVDKKLHVEHREYVLIQCHNKQTITLSLTVGTARYIMTTLDVARACNRSDISPVMIAPMENMGTQATVNLKIFVVKIFS